MPAQFDKHPYDIHRLTPGREGGLYELGNIIALCKDCHYKIEGLSPQEILNLEPYGLSIKSISETWFKNNL